MWFSCFASYGTGKSHCYCWPGLPPTSGFILNAKFLKVFINKNYFSPISLSLGLLWFTTLITMFMSHIYFMIVCLKLIPNKNVKFVRKRSQSDSALTIESPSHNRHQTFVKWINLKKKFHSTIQVSDKGLSKQGFFCILSPEVSRCDMLLLFKEHHKLEQNNILLSKLYFFAINKQAPKVN